jgi:hypothetical protein
MATAVAGIQVRGSNEQAAGHQPLAGPDDRPRGFLSRELIIKEALALLDEHGPGALSMAAWPTVSASPPPPSTPMCAARRI